MTPRASSRKSILAVDDDPSVLRVVSGLLGGDYEVRLAEGAPEALKDIKEKAPDLILLDVRMPGMDGLELLQAAMRSDSSQRVVMLTGDSDLDVVLRAMALGAQGYVTKPFSGEDLKNVVDHLLQPYEESSRGGCPWHMAPGAGTP
ncbi:MAG: hypothetical protein A2506_03680 [Elusimicrobia bacterium RIFOXYD12_FULL_66_9]|nr:MAG: hypothetical protein A2506_03680 [Elusimicrobia bacterium RIFOXYD12_FULL_66_9]